MSQVHKTRLTAMKLFGVLVLLMSLSYAVHGITAANTIINNQATASYTDSANTARTVTSNKVQTTIQQVAGLTLTNTQSKPGSAGSVITFPHIVTNVGNGVDSYSLLAADLLGDDYDFSSLTILPDADGNGVPDSTTAITQTPALDAGEVYAFVIEAVVPAGATDTQVGELNIRATSVFNASEFEENQDTVVVSDRAIIEVVKSISANRGEAGSGTYRVNLVYNNTSNDTARNISIIDALPTGMVYASNAVWSLGNVSLTDTGLDAQSSAPAITFCAYDVSCNVAPYDVSQLTLVIDEVGAGQSGRVSFDVNIDAAALPSIIFNTAQYQYDDGVATIALTNSNTVPFEIIPTVAVNIVGFNAADSQPGQTVSFPNTVTNNGNAVDIFAISLDTAGSTYPSGTVYNLFMQDGFTPLTDTNGDSVPDTGPLDPGASIVVIMQAIIPSTAAAGSYSIDKTAASNNLATVSDTDADTVTINLPVIGMDVTNNFPRGDSSCDALADNCGYDAGPAAAAQTVVPITPNNAGTYILYANNTSSISDSFDIAASTDPSFATQALPAGWSVVYLNDTDTVVSNTGPIAVNDSIRIRAVVSVPAGFEPGLVDIYFRLRSPVSGAQDIKHDAADVQVTEALVLSPDNVGQTSPGTVVSYSHVLTNNGNEAEADIALTAVNSQASNGWTILIYEDTNGSGVLDAGDDQISTVAALPPGANKLLFTRIFVPTSAGNGVSNTTTLTATYNAGADAIIATDITTVNPFNVDVVKTQSLDSDCNGEADGGVSSYTSNTFSVAPGQCVVYQINTQNNSAEPVLNVVIYDATPAYTFYSANQPSIRCAPAVCVFVAEPAAGANGTVEAQAGTLNAGESIQLYFNVGLEQ